jgi:hypothetical protein
MILSQRSDEFTATEALASFSVPDDGEKKTRKPSAKKKPSSVPSPVKDPNGLTMSPLCAGISSSWSLLPESSPCGEGGDSFQTVSIPSTSTRTATEVDLSHLTESNISLYVTAKEECVKKRGRKPQGGKLIKKTKTLEQPEEVRASVILHLKCFVKDLDNDLLNDHCHVQPYTDDVMASCYKSIKEPEVSLTNSNPGKTIHSKIKELEQNLHTNNVNDKKSGCFHCTYSFDNPAYYIPKCNLNGTYQVYGCFCMPECAAAYLFKEPIDTSVKFERYYMLNHIYGKANGYTQNIKLAPNPYYFLERFYGNLSIAEYRSLFKREKYFFIVDKPLTRVMPEIYEDNDTHIIHNKFVNANNKLKSKAPSKNAILNETFSSSSSH